MYKSRFNDSENLLPPYSGPVLHGRDSANTFVSCLGKKERAFESFIKSFGLGILAGVAVGSLFFIFSMATMTLIPRLAIVIGLRDIPTAVPLIAGATTAIAVFFISFFSREKRRIRIMDRVEDLESEDREDYSRHVAMLLIPCLIRFMRNNSDEWTTKKDDILELLISQWGYSEEYQAYWKGIARTASREELDRHIRTVLSIMRKEKLPYITVRELCEKANEMCLEYLEEASIEETQEDTKYLHSWYKHSQLHK